MSWITDAEDAAAEKVREILARPMPEDRDMIGDEGAFDPWDIFPALYGSYSGEFDQCAIEVLCEIRDNKPDRSDLGAHMLREMLCNANLCDYGTSPRVCFATTRFRALLPALIEKWRSWSLLHWGEEMTTKK